MILVHQRITSTAQPLFILFTIMLHDTKQSQLNIAIANDNENNRTNDTHNKHITANIDIHKTCYY